MQPAALAAALSMGVEEEGSDSGTEEVMVKSDPKKSIVVYVVRELKNAMKLCEVERHPPHSSFIPRKSESRKCKQTEGADEDHA
jgi:hypothetical protein